MKKLTPANRIDAVLMACPVEELPALLDRATLIMKSRTAQLGNPITKRTRTPKDKPVIQEAVSHA